MPRYVDAEARVVIVGGMEAKGTKVIGASAIVEAASSAGAGGNVSDTRKADEGQTRPSG